jgi:hypothetical protein
MATCISLKRLIGRLEYQGASKSLGPAGDGAGGGTFHQPSIRIMEDTY